MAYIDLIRYCLSDLNNKPDGSELFQDVSIKCVQMMHPDWKVFSSSGSAAGGDGGRDGYFIIPNRNIIGKIASSTQKDFKPKINDELCKCNYPFMVYCSNQTIKNTDRDYLIEQNEKILEILDITEISTLIEECNELQKAIGVPALKESLKIEQLRKNNQLIDEIESISKYLPRRTHFINNKDQAYCIDDFLNNRMDYKICLIDSPSGFGKTGYLKYLYYCIIYKQLSDIPPFFISLKNGYTNGLLKQTIDDVSSSFASDNCVQHYILLIDGVDEINNDLLKSLISEIKQLLNMSQSFIRLCVITGRTGEYSDAELINQFGSSICQATIEGLTSNDICQLATKRGSFFEANYNQINSLLALDRNADNVFYVTHALDYYAETASGSINLLSLLDYVSDKELKRLFKSEEYDFEGVSELAFEMTKRREAICSDRNRLDYVGYKGTQFQFTHKSIQEYLAAKYLSLKNPDFILKTILSLNLIIPHLKNLAGLLFNVLARTNSSGFVHLVNALKEEAENYYSMFKVDPSFLGKSIRLELVDSYLSVVEGYDYKHWSNPDFIKMFNYDFDENIKGLLSMIESECGEKRDNYIQQCYEVISEKENLSSDVKRIIYKIVFKEINSCKKGQSIKRSLLFMLAKLHIDYLPQEDIVVLIDYLKRNFQSDIFNPIISIIADNLSRISKDQYRLILGVYFDICKYNTPALAHFVPTQISSSTAFPESKIHLSTFSFPEFVNKIIAFDSSYFIETLRIINDLGCTLKDSEYYDRFNIDKEFFSVLTGFARNGVCDDSNTLILQIAFRLRYNHTFDELIEDMSPQLIINFMRGLLLENDKYNTLFDLSRVFGNFIKKRVLQDRKCFHLFMDTFSDLSSEMTEYLLSSFLIDELVAPQVKEEMVDFLVDRLNRNNLLKNKELMRQKEINVSFHKGFEKESFFNTDLRAPFLKFENDLIPEDCIYKMEWDEGIKDYSEFSPFAVFVIEELYREKGFRDYKSIADFLNIDYDYRILFLVFKYIESHNLSFDLLSNDEHEFTKSTIRRIIESNPYPVFMETYPSILKFVVDLYKKGILRESIVDSIMFSKSFGVVVLIVLELASLNCFDENEFAQLFDDFPVDFVSSKVLDAVSVIAGDSYCLDKVCRFFSKAIGYSEIIRERIHNELLPVLFKIIKENVGNEGFYYYNIMAFLKDNGISLSSICNSEEMRCGLVFDKERERFKSTIVYNWVEPYYKKSKQEIAIALIILRKYVKDAAEKEEKRQGIELILHYDKADYSAFNWLAKYLIHNDKCSLSEQIYGIGYEAKECFTTCKRSWKKLNALFARADSFEKELRRLIQNTVLFTYSQIAQDSCKTERSLKAWLKHLSEIAKKNPEYQLLIESSSLTIKERFIDSLY